MKTTTITEFRAKMKERLQEIEDDKDFLILSGPKKRDYVILTLEQFNAMEETAYLLSSPANTSRLMQSIEQDKNDQIVIRDLNLDQPGKSTRYKATPVRARKVKNHASKTTVRKSVTKSKR